MTISSFDDLLRSAREQNEPRRLLQGIDAVDAGQVVVEQDHIGLQRLGTALRLACVADDIELAHFDAPLRLLLNVEPDLPGARMLAHVRQGLLHDVQHLDLNVRRQRHALATHPRRRLQPGLVLELAQRGQQRGLDVLGVGAGAEVHQQLAHVAVVLAHTSLAPRVQCRVVLMFRT